MTTENPFCNQFSTASLKSKRSGSTDITLPESFISAIFSGRNDLNIIISAESTISHISPALADLLSLNVNTISGSPLADFCLFQTAPEQFSSALEKAPHGLTSQFTFWHPRSAPAVESNYYLEATLTPWKDQDKGFSGIVLRIDDQTEVERLKVDLDDAEKRLADFSAATSDWQWEMNHELRFVWISREITHAGISRNTLYGKHQKPLLETAKEKQAWQNHLEKLARREPFRDDVFRFSTGSGVRTVRTSGVPLYDHDGNFTGYRGTGCDITEVERVRSKARNLELRFISAIDKFPGSIALYDANEKLIVHNSSYGMIHGFSDKNLVSGLSYRQCLLALLKVRLLAEHNGEPIKDSERWVDDNLPRLKEAGGSIELHCSDGRWMKLTLQQLPEGGFLETLSDISDQKKGEFDIKEERNLLRSLIDNIPDYIYAKDIAGKFIVKNRSVTQYMNSVRKETLHLTEDPGEQATDYDFYKPEFAQAYRQQDLEVIEHRISVINQEERISPENPTDSIWVSTSKVPLYDTEGQIIGLVGTTRNITEEKLAEKGMLESNERFKDFAETAAELFWEIDENYHITFISERYLELTGHMPQSILGRSATRIIPRFVNTTESVQRVSRQLAAHQSFSELEICIKQRSGEPRHILFSGKPRFDTNDNFLGYRGAGRDITKSRSLEKKLKYQASHDELTKLPNRREFMRRLKSELSESLPGKQTSVLGYLDLDQFKMVNDSVGHSAGDALLLQVTSLIENHLRQSDTIARLGGDEFGVLINNQSVENAVSIFQRIIQQFAIFRFHWNNQVFGISISVGLVGFGDTNVDASELMSRADVACFAAKDAGRGRVHVYRPQVSDRSPQHKQLLMAAGIRNSISTDQFQLYAQPIATASKDSSEKLSILHHEILLRLIGDDDKIIMPGTFIPAAERYGLMGEIDRWVVSQTFKQLHDNRKVAYDITLTINLSGQSLTDRTLASFIKSELRKFKIKPARICFEITETAAIRNLAVASSFIAEMKTTGCTFALDDFGSGHSSLGYLKHFDIDYLKIDGSFIREITTDHIDHIMVTSIHQIGKSLGLATIAEYVEDPNAVKILKEIGVDFLQGYCIGVPVPLKNIFRSTVES